jgi:hypothetical protein
MKHFLLVLAVVVLLAVPASGISVNTFSEQIMPGTVEKDYDLILFSDTHIGRTLGADNLTSYERYSMLLGSANQITTTAMVNLGDLTNGWYLTKLQTKMYQDYLRLSSSSRNSIVNVKGNHDANNTAYWSMIGNTTWLYVYNDMLLAGIGCRSDSAEDWMQNDTCYLQYQADFLNSTIHSVTWNLTAYHYMFMHFEPDSTWTVNGTGVPTWITQYCRYFDVVFCGHEGGPASVLQQQNATVIHCAHLGDGTLGTDTYLTVKISRSTQTMMVVNCNFVSGTEEILIIK